MPGHLSLDKPVTEAGYLTAPNYFRYRSILRYFYLQHQRMKYWMVRDEVFSWLSTVKGFESYSPEQCQQDLDTLTEWKNLLAGQDVGKVQTIEEFKNRRFRYQLTPYTIEIERLMVKLESSGGTGGSLEASLFERIKDIIHLINRIKDESLAKVYGWWQDLELDFQRLNQNATDYIARLEGSEADELMNTLAFLTYKDSIVEYLRSFIRELQRHGSAIELEIKSVSQETIKGILESVANYHMTIPRIEHSLAMEEYKDEYLEEIGNRWLNLVYWFTGREGDESESHKLLDITNGIIRRITRFAYRIAERQNRSISRQREYMHILKLFNGCRTMDEAHCLSAALFGAFHTRHTSGNHERETDSINLSLWEESPFEIRLKPRTRQYREKSFTGSILGKEEDKKRALEDYLKRQREEEEILGQYIEGDCIDFAKLPEIEPFVRNTLLRWIGRALSNKGRMSRTEDGRVYMVHIDTKSPPMILKCRDGNLEMPPTTIKFMS